MKGLLFPLGFVILLRHGGEGWTGDARQGDRGDMSPDEGHLAGKLRDDHLSGQCTLFSYM